MLNQLVQPGSTAAEFLHHHWPRQSTLFQGPPERLPSLFCEPAIQSLESLLATGAPTELWWDDAGIRAAGAEPLSAARLYKRGGLSLRFMDIDSYVPSLRAVLDQMSGALETPVRRSFANVYLSPPNVPTAMHFDAAEVFIVQIKGTKRWRVASNRSVESPAWGWAGGVPDEEEKRQISKPFPKRMPADADEFLLQSGDVLFVPRGWWHAAEASEESISISLAFECLTRLDVALGVIRHGLITDAHWRHPAAGILTDSSRSALDGDLRALGKSLMSRGVHF